MDRATGVNGQLTIVTVATPNFSNSSESWQLHDVDDPQ
jgi:hypothetical protein